jgi:hypothetical protein
VLVLFLKNVLFGPSVEIARARDVFQGAGIKHFQIFLRFQEMPGGRRPAVFSQVEQTFLSAGSGEFPVASSLLQRIKNHVANQQVRPFKDAASVSPSPFWGEGRDEGECLNHFVVLLMARASYILARDLARGPATH